MMHNLEGKKLLILGGMRSNCEVVRKAKAMGIYVIVTDYNPPDVAPGKRIADKYFMVDAADVSGVTELIKREKIDGVFSGFAESLLVPYAKICANAKLPCYGTLENFEIFVDKSRYKELLRTYSIPVINNCHLSSGIDISDIDNLSYPVFVKPADNSGCRGTSICNNLSELIGGCQKARKHSKTSSVLVQPYLSDDEITIFWFFQNGKAYLTAVGNRHKERSVCNRLPQPVGYTFPSKYTKLAETRLFNKCERMFGDLGIREGMMFMQSFVVDESEIYVYDIGYRLTGSLEYKLLERLCGFSPMERMINYALTGSSGEDVSDKANPYFSGKYGWNISFLMRAGTISKLGGIREILTIPDVIDAVPDYEPGDTLLPSEEGLLKQICLRVLGASDTIDNIKSAIGSVHNSFSLTGINGESLLLEFLDTACIDGYVI